MALSDETSNSKFQGIDERRGNIVKQARRTGITVGPVMSVGARSARKFLYFNYIHEGCGLF